MTMKVYINSINVWLQGVSDATTLTLWANDKLSLPQEFTLPKPQYYPKGQLRRLSPFSKVALHCLDIPQALTQNLPLIFASQHGDLAKTVALIKDAAVGDDLSPTQFALSVHNATTGLFSIATNNTAPTTTISAGSNTFIAGLIEAAMQCQQESMSVIYTYCDFYVPVEYRQFEECKPARCITMILSNENSSASSVAININLNKQKNSSENKVLSDLSLNFIRYLYLQKNEIIQNKSYTLTLDFNG
ncbi:MAG: hypothetical protein COB83_10015 [Gammaproteobacteria bacterium]|nr:MAG: hypothetical protein COB83_10015 [Gammaproteobacteria bacterium]